jgi:RNA polymerase sigma-70 factor (ECF subfamily)
MPGSVTPTQPPAPDVADFRAWYQAHVGYVWGSLKRLGVPSSDVPDVCHDVFVLAWKQRAQLDPQRSVKPWLFAVAYRMAASYRRRHWFRKRSDQEFETVAAAGADPEQQALLRAELQRLQSALDQVPLGLRGVLLLHDFDEVPLQEIAVALKLPLQTTYSRLNSARKRFRQAFRQRELLDFQPNSDRVALGGSR